MIYLVRRSIIIVTFYFPYFTRKIMNKNFLSPQTKKTSIPVEYIEQTSLDGVPLDFSFKEIKELSGNSFKSSHFLIMTRLIALARYYHHDSKERRQKTNPFERPSHRGRRSTNIQPNNLITRCIRSKLTKTKQKKRKKSSSLQTTVKAQQMMRRKRREKKTGMKKQTNKRKKSSSKKQPKRKRNEPQLM